MMKLRKRKRMAKADNCMRILVLFISSLITVNTFAQKKVLGTVLDTNNFPLISAEIIEIGTKNRTETDYNGKFELLTTKDTCVIMMLYIGFNIKDIEITKDTVVTILATPYNYYVSSSKWRTIGTIYDISNSQFGVSFSNGYDEISLIHFEDFSADFVYKVSGYNNFKKDYGFEGVLGWKNRFGLFSLNYCYLGYSEEKSLRFNKIGISGSTYFRLLKSNLSIEPVYQSLNGKSKFGLNLGLQKVLLYSRVYSGLSIGCFGDYWVYSIYAQGFVFKKSAGLRISYEKIDRFDFLKFGLSYCIQW